MQEVAGNDAAIISPGELYGAKFHADRFARTIYAAETVLTPLIRNLDIQSVVDFGCGVGTWLSASKSLGVNEVLGIEGPWVTQEQLKIDAAEYLAHDLTEPTSLERQFDLAISLEVGEHLPPERAASFVSELCRSAKYVLFSAAIPEQGGIGHINEQWQSYWATLFEKHDFLPADCVRKNIWGNEKINWWYQQNIILYISKNFYEEAKNKMGFSTVEIAHQLDLVHPELYKRIAKTEEQFWELFERTKYMFFEKLKFKTKKAISNLLGRTAPEPNR